MDLRPQVVRLMLMLKKVMRSRNEGCEDHTAENLTKVVTDFPPENKKVLASLDKNRRHFQFLGMNPYS